MSSSGPSACVTTPEFDAFLIKFDVDGASSQMSSLWPHVRYLAHYTNTLLQEIH
jgi:hypothetical protein